MSTLERTRATSETLRQIQALAQEVQLSTDLVLATGKRLAQGESTSKDFAVARERMDESMQAYCTMLWTAVFGPDTRTWPKR